MHGRKIGTGKKSLSMQETSQKISWFELVPQELAGKKTGKIKQIKKQDLLIQKGTSQELTCEQAKGTGKTGTLKIRTGKTGPTNAENCKQGTGNKGTRNVGN